MKCLVVALVLVAALAHGQVYHVSSVGSGDGSEGSPWSLGQFQTFLSANVVLPGTHFYLRGEFAVPGFQPILLLLQNVEGTEDKPIVFSGQLDPSGYAKFRYDSQASKPAVEIRRAHYLEFYNIIFDVGSGGENDEAIFFINNMDPVRCITSIHIEEVSAVGQWGNGVRVAAGGPYTPSGCGVSGLSIYSCSFMHMRGTAIAIGNFSSVVPQATADNIYEHSSLDIRDSFFGESRGGCIDINSVDDVYLYQNSFINCGRFALSAPVFPDFVYTRRSRSLQFVKNVFNWNLLAKKRVVEYPSHGLRISDDSQGGWVYRNLFQGLQGSGVIFEPTVNGFVTPSGEGRFIRDWYVSFNLFEGCGSSLSSPSPSLYVRVDPALCSLDCTKNLRFVHNTIFVPGLTMRLIKIWASLSSSVGLHIVNNVLYKQAAQSNDVFIESVNNMGSELYILGNLYAARPSSSVLLRVASSSYFSIDAMRIAGYEKFMSSSVGSFFTVPYLNDLALGSLGRPTSDINPTFGSEEGGGPRFTNRMNGLGICVNASDVPLDPVFRCPGHERLIQDATTADPIEAYNFLDNSPGIGKGFQLSLLYDPEEISHIGEEDLMGRDVYTTNRASTDPGAIRYISSVDIQAFSIYEIEGGDTWYRDLELLEGSGVECKPLSNATFAKAFDIPPGSVVRVNSEGRMNILGGNSSMSSGSVFEISVNGTLRFAGQMSVGSNATITVSAARYLEFRNLLLRNGANFRFGTGGSPINITGSASFGGAFTIVLRSRPGQAGLRSTTTYAVATFPANSASGSFSSVTAQPSYGAVSVCDNITVTEARTATTLGVTVSVQPKNTDGCSGASSGGLSPGAIAGIAIGCVVAVAIIVTAVLIIYRRRRSAQLRDAVRLKVRSDTITASQRASNIGQ